MAYGTSYLLRSKFWCGLAVGLSIAVLFVNIKCPCTSMTKYGENTDNMLNTGAGSMRIGTGVVAKADVLSLIKDDGHVPLHINGLNYHQGIDEMKQIQFEDSNFHKDNDKVARKLEKKIRILCWVMTSPQNLNVQAIHVKRTWAKRCTVLVFISSKTNTSFPTVGINVSEGRDHLTAKTMQGFKYVFDKHYNDADWFVKADDDTYMILENLRYFLQSYSHDDPVYFGHHFKTIVKQGYYSGGAGYVLSKEALRRLVEQGQDPKVCRQDGGAEDAEFGKCMENLGVKTANSTDALGRSRFHCFDPETHLFGGYPDWYYKYDANGGRKGTESISDYAISFHYVPPQKMYALEFYIYHLRPYGIESGYQHLNAFQ